MDICFVLINFLIRVLKGINKSNREKIYAEKRILWGRPEWSQRRERMIVTTISYVLREPLKIKYR